jgi:uncharacterized membrane protein
MSTNRLFLIILITIFLSLSISYSVFYYQTPVGAVIEKGLFHTVAPQLLDEQYFLLSDSFSSNIIFESWNTTIKAFENQTATFNASIKAHVFVNIQNFSVKVAGDVKLFQSWLIASNLSLVPLNHSIQKINFDSEVNLLFNEVILANTSVTLLVNFISDGYIELLMQTTQTNLFQFLYHISGAPIHYLQVILALPKEYSLYSSGADLAIIPALEQNYTDNQFIYYSWPPVSLTGSESIIYYVKFVVPSIQVQISSIVSTEYVVLSEFSLSDLLTTVVAFIAGVVLGVALFFLYVQRSFPKSTIQKLLNRRVKTPQLEGAAIYKAVHLSIQEQKVIKTITANGGQIPQTLLLENLNYSKSNLSMYLAKLERAGFIKKEKIGRENIIKLIETIETTGQGF